MTRRDEHLGPRWRSLQIRDLRRIGAVADASIDEDRPRTRGECVDGERPCPWVGCRHHLYLDINPQTGTIKLNRPNLEPWELDESCSLDVGDRGDRLTLAAVGRLLNITRERARQLEQIAYRNPAVAALRLEISAAL